MTGVQTRTTKSVSFIRKPVNKDCHKYSFLPRTTAERNLLPASMREAPSLNIFKQNLQKLNLSDIKSRAYYN